MIMHRDPKRCGDLDDRARHVDVGGRRGRIAGGVIMHKDDRGRGELERALDHLAWIDRRVVDGTDLLALVGDQTVALRN
jgi:hypothetical protein